MILITHLRQFQVTYNDTHYTFETDLGHLRGTYYTFGTTPEAIRDAGEWGVEAGEVVDQVACIAHEQLPRPLTHSAVVFVRVTLQSRTRILELSHENMARVSYINLLFIFN